MAADLGAFLQWLQVRGLDPDLSLAYRQGAERILAQAGGSPVEPRHVEAARAALEAEGAKQALAHLRSVGDALRQFQRVSAAPPPASPSPPPLAPPASLSMPPPLAPPASLSMPPPLAPPSGRRSSVPARSGTAATRARASPVLGYVGLMAILCAGAAGAYLLFVDRPGSGGGNGLAGLGSSAPAADLPGAAPAARESSEAPGVRRAFLAFEAAVRAGDLARLRELTAGERHAEMMAADAASKLTLARAMYPASTAIESVSVTGDSARLSARAQMMGQAATGRAEMVRQAGIWKVDKIAWNISLGGGDGDGTEPARPARDVVRPADFPKLVGTWRGKETARDTEWTLTFSDDHMLEARSSRGESYRGEAVIRWDLGVEGGRIHMPPGWGPLDVELSGGSAPALAGKVALSAFSLSGGELKLCGGPPGFSRRVRSFESPGPPFRCMVLSRSAATGGEVVARAELGASPPASPSKFAESGSSLSPRDGPGEASFTFDGTPTRYRLKTGFFSDTRLDNPKEARLHFALPAETWKSNGQRIEITLDATQAGRHVANGDAIHESMFGGKRIEVGSLVPGGRHAVFKWVADGGQVYPPRRGSACQISVSSPYSGAPDSELIVSISRCEVHSAGIDHTLAGLELRVRGAVGR